LLKILTSIFIDKNIEAYCFRRKDEIALPILRWKDM